MQPIQRWIPHTATNGTPSAGAVMFNTYLKKSSLQNNWPFRAKHFSLSWMWQSLHWRHLACHVRSDTLRINRSRISSWQPPHFGMVAERMEIERVYGKCQWKLCDIDAILLLENYVNSWKSGEIEVKIEIEDLSHFYEHPFEDNRPKSFSFMPKTPWKKSSLTST